MSKYRIAPQSLGNRERIELQGKEANGSWSMMKGYNISSHALTTPSEERAEKRKSVFALLGIAMSVYALTAQEVEVDEELIDYITD